MIKIIEIINIHPYQITSKFNDHSIKSLDVKVLLDKHKYLEGINTLLDEENFCKAKIGRMGEIYWENIITTKKKNKIYTWNYDISPEYFYHQGIANF